MPTRSPILPIEDKASTMRAACLAAVLLMIIASPARNATAQIVLLERLPEGKAYERDRRELRVEKARLADYLANLQRVVDVFNSECVNVPRHSSLWQSCFKRKADLDSKRRLYNAEAEEFNSRVAELRRRIKIRRDLLASASNKVEGATQAAQEEARNRTIHLLEALEHGKGDWNKSLALLRARMLQRPYDAALRDAFAYLEGMYRGHLRARDLTSKYYHYAVRRWLEKDFTLAARAFAVAARNDPDDLELLRSFAFVTGQQHGSAECRVQGLCVSRELPEWASFFGPEHTIAIRSLEAEARRNPRDRKVRDALNRLKGIAVYAENVDSAKPLTMEAHRFTAEALDEARKGNHLKAAELYALAWSSTDGDRALLFLWHYHEGKAHEGGSAGATLPLGLLMEKMEEEDMRELSKRLAPAPSEMTAEAARRAFDALANALNRSVLYVPFYGMLTSQESAELGRNGQRKK